ncbi:MAG TPA: isocitrate lyase/phosphoenolpyruvate mutase family protein [Caulobacteraceae bacterium]|nr:isocitrate lyase/phosphoenolpyruvate mutase family protein [Caulobacteraceae bacterium]
MVELAEKRARFRRLHEAGCFVMPNCFDVGSARLIQSLGFKATASSSAGLAWTLGKADNRIELDDILSHLTAVCAATDIPVNADFENAFAEDPQGVAENVVRCAQTGVAALSVEDHADTASPVYDKTLSIDRVRAARVALNGAAQDVLLVARAEGLLGARMGVAEVIDRLVAFADAGADVLFGPGLREADDIAAAVRAVGPKPLSIIPPPSMTLPEVAELGVRRISVGSGLARAAYGAVIDVARQMAAGSFAATGGGVSGKAMNDLFGKGVAIT